MSYDTARRKYSVEGRLTTGTELGSKLFGTLDILMKSLDFCSKQLDLINLVEIKSIVVTYRNLLGGKIGNFYLT